MLLTGQGCTSLRTGLIITQFPWGYQKKNVYCVEKRDMCEPRGKKPHFWSSERLKKGVVNCARLRKAAQGCARLRTGLIITQIPWGYQKKKFIV